MYKERLSESLPRVEERIRQACEKAGRQDRVRLVAVTKGHPVDAVQAAIALGLTDCGENRVAELGEKIDVVGRHAVRWHLIGHLQRNKAEQAVQYADVVHSIDSLRLARQLSKDARDAGLTLNGLLQVNASGEETKSGLELFDARHCDEALETARQIVQLPGLAITGLMTMAPFTDDESVLRTTFRRTREFLETCRQQISGWTGHDLSMGMTNDFEIAIEEGSTMVRLGTILFGARAQ